MSRSPTPVALVPGKQQISKSIIEKAREQKHRAIAEHTRDPTLARRQAPDRDGDIGADDQVSFLVGRVQAAAHITERRTVSGERVRLFVDIPERNLAGADEAEKLVALPIDPAVTDRASRVVPDGEVGCGHVLRNPTLCGGQRRSIACPKTGRNALSQSRKVGINLGY